MKPKIKKGDTVQVISGSNRGKVGKVKAVYSDQSQISIEGVNVRKKNTKPTSSNPKPGIVEKEAPIHYSNVQILDSKGKPTRISIKRVEKEGKFVRVRIAKTTGEELQ